jgi:hypothetical protein
MDEFLRAILTMVALIAIMLLIVTYVPGWLNSVNSHELTFNVSTNLTGVFV